jgi:hypothetical protein
MRESKRSFSCGGLADSMVPAPDERLISSKIPISIHVSLATSKRFTLSGNIAPPVAYRYPPATKVVQSH